MEKRKAKREKKIGRKDDFLIRGGLILKSTWIALESPQLHSNNIDRLEI